MEVILKLRYKRNQILDNAKKKISHKTYKSCDSNEVYPVGRDFT